MMNPKPIFQAHFKILPQDFVVKEIIEPLTLSDNGEHLWLYIKKININTEHLIKLLAKVANIPIMDIGYSGIKDRRAVTYQWVSLRLPKIFDKNVLENEINKALNDDEFFEIIQYHWHNKKLNRGTHKANHFDIVLKNIIGNQDDILIVLENLKLTGIPNFFGEQRFGNDNKNLAQAKTYAQKILKTKNPKRKLSQKDAFLVSVMRSELFNQILQKRVENHTWNVAIQGDVFNLNGTNSVFKSDVDDDIIKRMAMGDIHSTAPLFGIDGKITSSDMALTIEQEIFNQENHQIFIETLLKLNLKSERRALRVLLSDLTWQWQENALQFSFSLPKGAFATSVLDYLVTELKNGAGNDT